MHSLLTLECYTIHGNQFLLHNVESHFYEVILYEKIKMHIPFLSLKKVCGMLEIMEKQFQSN